MPNRNFQKVDFTDPARHGAHVGRYYDGDIIGPLKVRIHPNRTVHFPEIINDGVTTILQMKSPQSDITGLFYRCCNLHSIAALPSRWLVEVVASYNLITSGMAFCSFIGVVDEDFDEFTTYWKQQRNTIGPQPFQLTANFDTSSSVYIGSGIRNISGGIPNYYSMFPVTPTSVVTSVAWKSDRGMGLCFFKEAGDFVLGYFSMKENVYDFDKRGRFNIGNGQTWHVAGVGIRTILLSEYNTVDLLPGAATSITSDGTIEGGAPDAKAALTDGTETTRIVLNPGQYIEIDMTGTAKDVPIFAINVTADSTATNYLSTKIATDSMGPVWSVSVSMGNTMAMRYIGEKKTSAFTNTIRSLFYPEIRLLCGLSLNETEGCRRIRIENNSAAQIKVYDVEVLQGMKEIAALDSTGDDENCIASVDITGVDVPIGATGTIQEVNVINTSESDTASCNVLMLDDGFPNPAVAAVEYADNAAGPWYDKLNPPPAPDGIVIGPVVPEGNMPFYIRTKLPTSGQLLQKFSAQFQIKMVNV